ncbi:hypothetical protein BC567DRAFT_29349 [Phyllosticta citribraziliensis]
MPTRMVHDFPVICFVKAERGKQAGSGLRSTEVRCGGLYGQDVWSWRQGRHWLAPGPLPWLGEAHVMNQPPTLSLPFAPSLPPHSLPTAAPALSLLPSLATNTIFEISHRCHSSNYVPNSCVAPASLLTSLARSQPSHLDSPRLGSRPFSHARSHAAPDSDVLDN